MSRFPLSACGRGLNALAGNPNPLWQHMVNSFLPARGKADFHKLQDGWLVWMPRAWAVLMMIMPATRTLAALRHAKTGR